MRYVLLIMSWIADVVIAIAIAVVWFIPISEGASIGIFVFVGALTLLGLKAHKKAGGLENWKSNEIKKYLVNAKTYGL